MPTLASQLQISQILGPLDWLIFFAVIIATVMAIFFGQRLKKKSPNKDSLFELLLMGRQLTLPLFIATLVATWYGGIFSVTQISFNYGVFNFLTQGFFWYVTYIIFALWVIPKISQYQAVTLPDLIGKMFGPKSAKLGSVLNLINLIPVVYVLSLGILIQAVFSISLEMAMAIGLLFVVAYSFFGGFRAVVFSDLIQFCVMCSGVFLIVVYSYIQFGGIEFLQSQLPKKHLSITGGQSFWSILVWGIIALSTLVDPNFYQRCFAASSPGVAKKGILISTIVWFLFDIGTTLGGLYAKAVIPDAASEQAYLIYAAQVLPSGLKGFFLAGICATILSTLDSYLFLAGTTLSHDLLKKRKHAIKWHKMSIVFVALWAFFLGLFFEADLKLIWKTLGSYSAACLLLPVVCGYLFPNKISDRQFFNCCVSGIVGTSLWIFFSRIDGWPKVDELYIGASCTGLYLLVHAAARCVKRFSA